jgi:hypothetical protein
VIRDGEQTRSPPVAGEQQRPGRRLRLPFEESAEILVGGDRVSNVELDRLRDLDPIPHHDRPGLGVHPRSPPTTVSATQPMACSGWTSAQRAFDANSADAPWFREVTSTANESSASPSRTGPPRQPLSSRSPYPGRSRARRRSSSLRPTRWSSTLDTMSRQFRHDPHSPDGRMPSFDAYVERAAASSPSGPSRNARCHSPITPARM